MIGYSLGAAIVDRDGARLSAPAGYRFVAVEIEYKGPVSFNPLWFDEILLSDERRSHLWIGMPIRSQFGGLGLVTFAPFAFAKDDALATFESADRYMRVMFQIELSQKRLMLRFRDERVAFELDKQ
jgi:hypothetical protein